MGRPRRQNILRVVVKTARVEDIGGERLIIIPTSATGWHIAFSIEDVAALAKHLWDKPE
jgi:hypothetical protein